LQKNDFDVLTSGGQGHSKSDRLILDCVQPFREISWRSVFESSC